MKRYFPSLLALVIAASLFGVGTAAFFSDTETSTENTFTTGAIDLLVDSQASYNGFVCEDGVWTCEPWADSIVSFVQGTRKDGGAIVPDRSDPTKALGVAEDTDELNFVSLGLGIGGEITFMFDNMIMNGAGNDIRIYETSFGNTTCASYPETAEVAASQNGSDWVVLGSACLDAEFDLGSLAWAQYVRITDTTNPDDFTSNAADGYDLDGIQALHCSSEPNLEGEACANAWELTNLGPEYQFFNVNDVKPGDRGRNAVSLHVYNNDAYACMITGNVRDNDLGLMEPEVDAGDNTDGPGNGELSDQVTFFAWMDDGDMNFELDEVALTATPQTAGQFLQSVTELYTPNTNSVLAAEETAYVGIAWCAGTMGVDANTNAITCDATGMDNTAQTDELLADIAFYVEQSRNNGQFTCPDALESTNSGQLSPTPTGFIIPNPNN